jgi:2-polyprenyl-3-methyl-5-hydroxy-6-metoxy-1,4-benzoquinol methylase
MPISSFATIPDIVNEVIHKRPKKILDLGIGNGMYGALVRNYFADIEIVGIEGWDGYRCNNWLNYNKVIIGVMPKVLNRITDTYDVIIMADVIEHFDTEQGLNVIDKLKAMLAPGGILLISTPAVFVPQSAVGGNELERHRSLWKSIDGFVNLRTKHPDKYGHYMNCFKFENK